MSMVLNLTTYISWKSLFQTGVSSQDRKCVDVRVDGVEGLPPILYNFWNWFISYSLILIGNKKHFYHNLCINKKIQVMTSQFCIPYSLVYFMARESLVFGKKYSVAQFMLWHNLRIGIIYALAKFSVWHNWCFGTI